MADNHVYDCNTLGPEDYLNLQIPTKYEHDTVDKDFKYYADVCNLVVKTFPLVIIATTYIISLSHWKWRSMLVVRDKTFIEKVGCSSDICLNIIHDFPSGVNQMEAPGYGGPYWGEEAFTLIHSVIIEEHLYVTEEGNIVDALEQDLNKISNIRHVNQTHIAYIQVGEESSRIHIIGKDKINQKDCDECEDHCIKQTIKECISFGKVRFNYNSDHGSFQGCSINSGPGFIGHSPFSSYFFPTDGRVFMSIRRTCSGEIVYQFSFGNNEKTYLKGLHCSKGNRKLLHKRSVSVDMYNQATKRIEFDTRRIMEYINGLAEQFNDKMVGAYRLLSDVKIDIQHQNIALYRDGLISANVLISLEFDIPLRSFLVTTHTRDNIRFKRCNNLKVNCVFNPSLFNGTNCKSMPCHSLVDNSTVYMINNVVRDKEFFMHCTNKTFWLSKTGFYMVNEKVDKIITVPHFVQNPLYNMHENFFVESKIPLELVDVYPLNDPSVLHGLDADTPIPETNWNNVYKTVSAITYDKCHHYFYLEALFYSSMCFFITNLFLMFYVLHKSQIRDLLQAFINWLLKKCKKPEEEKEENIEEEEESFNLGQCDLVEALEMDEQNNRELMENRGGFSLVMHEVDDIVPLENSINSL